MRLLLTSVAHERYWSRLARPGVDALVLAPDGTLVADGGPVDAGSAGPEIAWSTSDLFVAGAPIRPFFGLLRRSPSLRWFQSAAAGFDNPVFADLAARGVRICNTHANGIPIAEYVLWAVLDHFHRPEEWRAARAERAWRAHDHREVHGSTWLVVGLGGIGTEVATRARAFGATVIGCRRTPSPDDPTDRTVTPGELSGVVGSADVVVLAAPANPESIGLVDRRFLASMRPGSMLVNVGRGSLVDEAALVAALDEGRPEAAVLDVFATEPLPADSPLWRHPRVVVTPHNAAGGIGRYDRQTDLFAENLGRWLDGRPLLNEITDLLLASDRP